MSEHEMFKTTLMGGFDKDDVLEQIQHLKDDAAEQQLKLKKQIADKDAKIAELMKRIELKDAHQDRLEAEIHDKYQKYIDNYESIGRLVFEAQLKADETIKEAEIKRDTMIAEAEIEARHRVESVQSEIDDKLKEGKKKYIAVQDEMNEIVQLINQAQKRFMASYKEVHQIISTMPSSLDDIGEEEVEADISKAIPNTDGEEIHLGDTQELDILDTLEDISLLEEFDEEDEEDDDEKIAMQISRLLSQEDEFLLDDELEN